MEREPGGDQRCSDYEESEVSKAAVLFFEVRDALLAGLLALFIFFGRGKVRRRHRGIIAYPLCLADR